MIFIRHPFDQSLKCLDFKLTPVIGQSVKDALEVHYGYTDFKLLYNGRKLQDDDIILEDSTVQVTFSLPGGKGGFGSMLRAIGAQIEKTTNREACRDLSGRRLRDINEEQRLKKWIAKEAEREAEKIKRRKARIERLKSKPAHKFFDFEYEKEISSLPERVNDALTEGLQKVKQPTKRPAEDSVSAKPIKKLWITGEFSATSSDSDSDANGSYSGRPSEKHETDSCDSDPYKLLSCSSPKSSHFEPEDSSVSQPGPSTSQPQLCLDNFTTQTSSSSNSGENSMSAPGSNCFKNGSSSESGENSLTEPGLNSFKDSSSETINITNFCSESGSCKKDVHLKIGEKESSSPKSELSGKESDKLLEENRSKGTIDVNKKPECGITFMENNDAPNDEVEKKNSETKGNNPGNEPENTLPINLLEFQKASDLEVVGLEKLKSELMIRGLKCGGTLTDRAQRLWKVRDLQPHEYPASILAKIKK